MRSAGINRAASGRRRILLASLLALAHALAPSSAAGKKDRQQSFALIAGTVFRDTGFALPGAEVTLTATPAEASDKKTPVKLKPMKLVSSPRGEFTFRVPAVPMRYNVSVKAAGFQTQEKGVTIIGDERIDVFFRLETEPKP